MIEISIPSGSKKIVLESRDMDPKMVELLRKRFVLYDQIRGIDIDLIKYSKNRKGERK
jgi:hypothetical protein